jgi:hypothetical protein
MAALASSGKDEQSLTPRHASFPSVRFQGQASEILATTM